FSHYTFFVLLIPLPPRSTLFPYTTLFRSALSEALDQPGPAGLPSALLQAAAELGASVRLQRHWMRLLRSGHPWRPAVADHRHPRDRKSTRLNSSHVKISYAVFCLKKKKKS